MNHQDLIKQMTLEEKASLMSGQNFWNTKAIERLGIPSIMLTDGPHGLRKQGGKADHLGLNKSLPATCYPTAATLANSWDKSLLFDVGQDIGKEARSEGVSVLLGPGLNIKRNPLCGRNFEYFSEDPYLTGELASEMVKGIQSNGISACPKHYAVNSQEHMRMTIDEIVDERSLREIYLTGFEKVVKESNPLTMMSSYNMVNGEFANENQHLANDILYSEWGFDGVVVTDWGGNNDRVAGLKAHNQLEMPSTNGITDKEIVDAIHTGTLKESILDEAVDQLLSLLFKVRLDDKEAVQVDYNEHYKKSVEAARQSMVLLKNENNILPLKTGTKVAVIGDFAKNPRYQGAGSSLINPYKLSNPLESLQDSPLNIVGYAQGFKRMGGKSNKLLREATSLAEFAEVVLIFIGLDESREAEGVDREDLKLAQNQLELVESLVKVNENVIVVLSGGGALELPFADHVQGILHTYLSGQGGGEAVVDILLGKYNPSGKLSETFPIMYTDIPSSSYYPGQQATSEHKEGLFIGYRYFETANVPVRYPFGYGLSYTTFKYSDFVLDGLTVSFDISNTGKVAGAEIAQLYIEKVDSKIFRSKKELKGFDKVYLEPGETKRVTLKLTKRDFSYYNPESKDWEIESGSYKIQVGSSIQAIHLEETVEMAGVIPSIFLTSEFPHYAQVNVKHIPDSEFEKLVGRKLPPKHWDRHKDLGMNDTINQAQSKNWVGKLLYKSIMFFHHFFKKIGKPLTANNVYFIINMPFRQVDRFTGGKISKKNVETLLRWINR
ncbi:glycoside hydrolase family 3 C-terminal domain-containing protein [Ferdinandcohnia quinoae]|uniref:Glycoside hydrolase family 3 C-terminal domain-containing protein n=1 Tax=Fredinandcohnia quinoae TaxID=2918902 RepID=A0AAW5E3E5_9BACI|nr:glycoside hydrolase family 3 C-terminal domain-containing protein [Fredinandcohnia sp. SECRCQ15]MCH1626893.1 glycoside hydrolase family 3 C-terminal domain-containing protein [Fredinandcohnia sp. SECRCQ15]